MASPSLEEKNKILVHCIKIWHQPHEVARGYGTHCDPLLDLRGPGPKFHFLLLKSPFLFTTCFCIIMYYCYVNF